MLLKDTVVHSTAFPTERTIAVPGACGVGSTPLAVGYLLAVRG